MIFLAPSSDSVSANFTIPRGRFEVHKQEDDDGVAVVPGRKEGGVAAGSIEEIG